MTQTMLSPTTVDKMKVPYNDLYCEAKVDTLMQIGNEVIDIVETIDNSKDCETPKKEVIKETVVKKEKSRAKGSTDVKPRKPRRMRKKSTRQHPYNTLARAQAPDPGPWPGTSRPGPRLQFQQPRQPPSQLAPTSQPPLWPRAPTPDRPPPPSP